MALTCMEIDQDQTLAADTAVLRGQFAPSGSDTPCAVRTLHRQTSGQRILT